MPTLNYRIFLFIALFIIALTACSPTPEDIAATTIQVARSIYATQTIEATLVPPTKTPTPTPAIIPEIGDSVTSSQWQVKVISAKKVTEFDTYSYSDPDPKNRMVVVTLEYTYLGAKSMQWSPEGVILIHIGGIRWQGWASTPRLYQSQISSDITDFEDDALFILARPGITETVTFVYEFPKDFSDFLLFFPESQGISIQLEQANN